MIVHSLVSKRQLDIGGRLLGTELDGVQVILSGEPVPFQSKVGTREAEKALSKIGVNCQTLAQLLHGLLVLVLMHQRGPQPIVEVLLRVGVLKVPDDMPGDGD